MQTSWLIRTVLGIVILASSAAGLRLIAAHPVSISFETWMFIGACNWLAAYALGYFHGQRNK